MLQQVKQGSHRGQIQGSSNMMLQVELCPGIHVTALTLNSAVFGEGLWEVTKIETGHKAPGLDTIGLVSL